MPIKIRNWFNKSTDTGIDYNNKLVLFIFIINTIVLFFVVFLKLLIISNFLKWFSIITLPFKVGLLFLLAIISMFVNLY